MTKKCFTIAVLAICLFFSISSNVFARVDVTDWYIKDFKSEIVVNKDSSLDVTEKITADCGRAFGKHGIFRILPQNVKIGSDVVKTPVQIISITDFNDNPLQYSESTNTGDDTVTWKIGNPDKMVQGVNYYKIHYRVENAIRFQDQNFDELYWNLNGNFWDLEIDNFHATINFPKEITDKNSTVDYYTGQLGSKDKSLAKFSWSAPNVLEFDSTSMLGRMQGITVSVITPKNIFTPHAFGFMELYGRYLFLLIPVFVFMVCFLLWWKYGKDPRVDKTVIAEYDAPGNLSPLEMGLLMTNGKLKNEFITAEIIGFATKGIMNIKETHKKILFFDSKDYEFSKLSKPDEENKFGAAQKLILSSVFKGLDGACLSNLKNSFHTNLKDIKKAATNSLKDGGLITTQGLHFATALMIIGGVVLWLSFMAFGVDGLLSISLIISGLIMLVFSFLMPKRTPAGADLNWQVKGFKLFMETVDKDRAVFYEKENIFEKFLPYAIMFGITGIWIKKMKEIYGEQYFSNYAPIWYAGSVGAFDVDSFSSTMNNLSAAIAANTSSPSGGGGAGGSGGGGGGGGGGGW